MPVTNNESNNSSNNFNNSKLLSKSVTSIIFSNYANQAMFYIYQIGYICASLISNKYSTHSTSLMSFKGLKNDFGFLQELFVYEFIFVPGEIENDLNEAIERLSEANIIQIKNNGENNNVIEINDKNAVHQISRLITPFIRVYALIFKLLLSIEKSTLQNLSPKTTIFSYLQKEISKIIESEKTNGSNNSRLAFLNNEVIKNAFHTLLKKKILLIKPWNEIVIDRITLNLVAQKLEKFNVETNSDDTCLTADSIINVSGTADIIPPRSRL
jgi:hypothetical protein